MYRMKAPLASAGPDTAPEDTERYPEDTEVRSGGYGAAGVAAPADGPVVGGEFASRLSRQG